MTPEQYQNLARRTLVTDNEQDTLAMCALGIAGEAGEICDILKKHLFHKNGKPLDADKLADEAGDLLWYASILAYTLSVPMQDIMPVLTFPGGSGTSLALVAMTLTEAAGDIAFYVRVETYSYDASGETKTHGLRNLIRGLAFIAGHICLSLEDIMQRNIAKLEARHNGGNGFQAHYESDSGDSRPSRFFVIDNYTLETIADCSTKTEAQKAMEDESNETGLFVYSIVEAVDEKALNQILAKREGYNS